MSKIGALAKKELNYFINSSLGYVVIVPFIFISFFLYFKTSLVYGVASLRPYFDLLPWFLIFLAPAITMHILSEEKSKKSLELLVSHPLSEVEIVLSKFIGVFCFYLLILGATLPLTIPMFVFSKVDIGILISQYLGAAFTGATFISIGIFASSLTGSVISSFLIGGFVSFVLTLLGMDFITLAIPQPFGSTLGYFSVGFHNQNVSRGLLDFSDILYFISACTLFLILAVFKISESKLVEIPSEKRKLHGSLITTVIVAILLNAVAASYPLRLDLTANKRFSLSSATKLAISGIDDVLTIKAYISPDLPPSMHNVATEVMDTLADYKHYGKNIKVERYSPTQGSDTEKQAQSAGVYPVQFNTIGSSSYQLQNGYLGISLRFGSKTESLPFIKETSDLEYQLTSKISKLTSRNEKKIAIFSDAGGNSGLAVKEELRFGKLSELVGNQYSVQTTKIDSSFATQKPDLLILAGIKNPLENPVVEAIKNYLESNGKALFLLDKVVNDSNSASATIRTTGLENLLESYGVTLNSDLVYDGALAETIQFSRGQTAFLTPYPFWFKALPDNPKFPATSQIQSVTLLWPSSLSIKSLSDYNTKSIIKTSKNAGVLSGSSFDISPDKLSEVSFRPGGKELSLAAIISKKGGADSVAIVSNSRFASDNYYSPNNQNLAFTAALIDYLILGPKALVPIKDSPENFFVFTAPWQPVFTQWGETLGVPLAIILFGVIRIWKRRIGYRRIYARL
jgi:ABC-2 type transport system permease protein